MSNVSCLTAVALLATACAAKTTPETVMEPEPLPEVSGPFSDITVLTFSPEGTLFLADSGTGRVHAMTPPAADNPQADAWYNLKDLHGNIAAGLGTTKSSIRIRDLAIHPTTKEAYLAVGRVVGDDYAAAVVVTNQSGAMRLLDLTGGGASVAFPNTPVEGFTFYGDVPARDLTFTDLEFHDGMLYAAGMSNADFASTLYTVPAALEGDVTATSVEIFHAVHNQTETRAPIRTMQIVEFDEVPYLIAAYTCTPLVAVPVADLKDGAHIRGKTIAELGYGNTPGDLIKMDVAMDAGQDPMSVLFLSNHHRAAQMIPLPVIAGAIQGEGLSEQTMREDLGAIEAVLTSAIDVADQDPAAIAVVRRDLDNGDVELLSYPKSGFLRLSEYQSEYEVPTYDYAEQQANMKMFHNQQKQAEGHHEFVKP